MRITDPAVTIKPAMPKPTVPVAPATTPTATGSPAPAAPKAASDACAADLKANSLGKAAQSFDMDAPPYQVEGKNTCAAANHERALYEQRPGLHDRLAKGLKDDGAFQMPNGQVLELSPENEAWIAKQECSDAEKDAMRVQAAMMDYANGDKRYAIADDVSTAPDGTTQQGLTEDEAKQLDQLDGTTTTETSAEAESAVTDECSGQHMSARAAEEYAAADAMYRHTVEGYQAAQAAGKEYTIQLYMHGSKHTVTVTGVDPETGTVTVSDTRGSRTLSKEQLDRKSQNTEDTTGDDTTMGTTTTTPTGGGRKR